MCRLFQSVKKIHWLINNSYNEKESIIRIISRYDNDLKEQKWFHKRIKESGALIFHIIDIDS